MEISSADLAKINTTNPKVNAESMKSKLIAEEQVPRWNVHPYRAAILMVRNNGRPVLNDIRVFARLRDPFDDHNTCDRDIKTKNRQTSRTISNTPNVYVRRDKLK